MSKTRVLLAATFVFMGAAESPSCLGDDNVRVINKEQKLDVVLKSLKDANAKCEEQHLAVDWKKGLSGKNFRKNLYTPVDEVKIDSLKQEKPKA